MRRSTSFDRPRRAGVALATVAVAALGVLGVAAAAPAAASPEVLGELTFYPGTGRDIDPMYSVTSGPCPAAATNVLGTAYGKGFPAEGQVVIPNQTGGLSRTDRFIEPFQDTMAGFAATLNVKLSGPYRIVLKCQDRLGTKVYGVFEGTITFTSPTTYQAKETALVLPSPETSAPATTPSPRASGSVAPTATGGASVVPPPGAAAPNSSPKPGTTGSAPAAAGSAPTPAATGTAEAAPLVAGSDTNAGTDAPASRTTSAGSSRWLLIGVGALLVILAIALVLRRTPRPAPTPTERGRSSVTTGAGPSSSDD